MLFYILYFVRRCCEIKIGIITDIHNNLVALKAVVDQFNYLYQGLKPKIHTNTVAADDVTWVILPYVYEQYGN
jgi:hypothetical protein